MDKLKPCPFCGGEAMFLRKTYSVGDTTRGWGFGVCCKKCDATLGRTDYKLVIDFECSGEIKIVVDARKQAIEAWNRRAGEE